MKTSKIIGTSCAENIDCLVSIDGATYVGINNKTKSGRTCQHWKAQTPHFHKKGIDQDENYCRNPDDKKTVWCYTMDPKKRKDFCDIQLCTDCNTVTTTTTTTARKTTTSTLSEIPKTTATTRLTAETTISAIKSTIGSNSKPILSANNVRMPNERQISLTELETMESDVGEEGAQRFVFDDYVYSPQGSFGMITLDKTYKKFKPQETGSDIAVQLHVLHVTRIDSIEEIVGLEIFISLKWEDNRINWTYGGPQNSQEYEFSPKVLR